MHYGCNAWQSPRIDVRSVNSQRSETMDIVIIAIVLLLLFGGGGGLYWGLGAGWGLGPIGLILFAIVISFGLFGYRGRGG